MLSNKIPKSYVKYDLYNNLVDNDNENYFFMNARPDSFEVSYKGYLIFSKIGGNYWPNIELVANKCAAVAYHEAHRRCNFSVYLAGMSPKRDGTFRPTTYVRPISSRTFRSKTDSTLSFYQNKKHKRSYRDSSVNEDLNRKETTRSDNASAEYEFKTIQDSCHMSLEKSNSNYFDE